MMNRTPVTVFGLSLAIVLLTGMGAGPPMVGGPAPPFDLTDLQGKPVRLTDYRGKVVLLNFWATWCEPCKKEMPEIQAAYEAHRDHGLVVLAVNFGEQLDRAAAFAHHGKMTFPVLIDPRADTAARYGVVNLPVTYFIDGSGVIRDQVFGGTLTKAGITEIFMKILNQDGPSPHPNPAS